MHTLTATKLRHRRTKNCKVHKYEFSTNSTRSLKCRLTYTTFKTLHMKESHARREQSPIKPAKRFCARHGWRPRTQQHLNPLSSSKDICPSVSTTSIIHQRSARQRKNDQQIELVCGFVGVFCGGWGFHGAVGFGLSPMCEYVGVWGSEGHGCNDACNSGERIYPNSRACCVGTTSS